MRRLLLHTSLVLTVLLLTSCRPRGVLSTKEMTDVLFDIHLVEAMSYNPYGGINPNWKGEMSEVDFTDLAYQSVLKKHDIDEEVFYASIAYYSKKMRLFKRIYLDLNDRFSAYAQSIDTWTETKQTQKAVNEILKKEEAHIRALYEYMHIKPDTTTHTAFSFRPDSVKVMNWRQINRLMRRSLPVKTASSIILKDILEKQKKALSDSTGKSVQEVIAQGEIPSVDVLLKQALPMDQLLKLRDAGAYDALMNKEDNQEDQPATQPTRRTDRSKRLRERVPNRR